MATLLGGMVNIPLSIFEFDLLCDIKAFLSQFLGFMVGSDWMCSQHMRRRPKIWILRLKILTYTVSCNWKSNNSYASFARLLVCAASVLCAVWGPCRCGVEYKMLCTSKCSLVPRLSTDVFSILQTQICIELLYSRRKDLPWAWIQLLHDIFGI
jgi:hypothetical protein